MIAKNELGFHHRGHGAHRVRISINAAVGFYRSQGSARRRSVLARDLRSESRASTPPRMNGYVSVSKWWADVTGERPDILVNPF